MTPPPENEKAEDIVETRFIPLREPPGRLGAIVRRLKQMTPPPPASRNAGAGGKLEAE